MTTEVTCKHCSHTWEYKGDSKVGATCPSCSLKTPIHPQEDDGF